MEISTKNWRFPLRFDALGGCWMEEMSIKKLKISIEI